MIHALFIGFCALLAWWFPVALGPVMLVMAAAYIFYSLRSPESRCRRLFIRLALILVAVPGVATLLVQWITNQVAEEHQQPWLAIFRALSSPHATYGMLTYVVLVLAAGLALVELVLEKRRRAGLSANDVTFDLTLPQKHEINLLANSQISGISGPQISACFHLTLRNKSTTAFSFDCDKFVLSWGPFYTAKARISPALAADVTQNGGLIKVAPKSTTERMALHVYTNTGLMLLLAKLPRFLWPKPRLDYVPTAATA